MQLGRRLAAQRQMLAVAESCTGGLLCELLTHAAGASAFFAGGIVSYSNTTKTRVLGVRSTTLAQHGAVSANVATEMALQVRARLQADWGLSITGIAGPSGGSKTKPVGTVYVALASPDGGVQVDHLRLRGDRSRIRRASAVRALVLLRQHLLPEHSLR